MVSGPLGSFGNPTGGAASSPFNVKNLVAEAQSRATLETKTTFDWQPTREQIAVINGQAPLSVLSSSRIDELIAEKVGVRNDLLRFQQEDPFGAFQLDLKLQKEKVKNASTVVLGNKVQTVKEDNPLEYQMLKLQTRNVSSRDLKVAALNATDEKTALALKGIADSKRAAAIKQKAIMAEASKPNSGDEERSRKAAEEAAQGAAKIAGGLANVEESSS